MYFKKTILQKVMFAKSYHTINVCIFSSYIRASFMQIKVVLVQLASCCCLSTIHNRKHANMLRTQLLFSMIALFV